MRNSDKMDEAMSRMLYFEGGIISLTGCVSL